jgi:hypothetical protein
MEPDVSLLWAHSLKLDPILNQMNPVQFLIYNFFKMLFNVLPSKPRSYKGSLSLRFSEYNLIPVSRLSSACYMSLRDTCLDFVFLLIVSGTE